MTLSLIPESAPFTVEQRAWLNGFLAGWVGLEVNGRTSQALPSTVLESLPTPEPVPAEPEESLPWHDPNLTIVERLELAEGKPLERRLMAAMAQLDCGACGYVCKTYSEAIVAGNEKNLSLCSPGGKNTAKAIKQLLKDGGGTNGNGSAATNGAAKAATNGSVYDRANPFLAKLKTTSNLNQPGSAKHTAHVVIDLSGSGLNYRVGDSLGVYPTNPPELVDAITAAARLNPDKPVTAPNGQEISFRDALRRHYCLREASEELLAHLAEKTAADAERAAIAAALADESYENFDALDALQLAPSAELSEPELLEYFSPLAPRLYSIASSLRAHPEEVHLTVGRVAYEQNGRERLGVASTMLADRIEAGDSVGVFVHSATDFTVPADPAAAMIMVGPGTGIAPFRAMILDFLHKQTDVPNSPLLLYWGLRYETDVYWADEFGDLEKKYPNFKFNLILSKPADIWTGKRGHVTEHIMRDVKDLPDSDFYLCGNKEMIKDVKAQLLVNNVPEAQIKTELFY